jgi:hypothetical protein
MKFILVLFAFISCTTLSLANGEDTLPKKGESVLNQEKRFLLHDIIFDVIQTNYGAINTYPGFDLAIRDFVHQRITGEKNLKNFDLPDVFYGINFQDIPSETFIKSHFQECIDQLKASGLPIKPDRYRIGIIEENGRAYVVLALDELYIPPGTD